MQMIKILAEPRSIDALFRPQICTRASETLNACKLRVEISFKNSLIETSNF